MRLILMFESPMDRPNLPMRLSTSIVRPDMVILMGSFDFSPFTESVSIRACAVTACSERSNVPLIVMPLKSTALPSWAIFTGAIRAVDVAKPPKLTMASPASGETLLVSSNSSLMLSVLAISLWTKASLGAIAPRARALLGKGPCSMEASNSTMPAGMPSGVLSLLTNDRP